MRILVVEDEPDLARAVREGLEAIGFAVDEAHDGREGLLRARQVDYDAIVLDLMLPVLDGWAVLAKLREEKDTPVLILTARDAVVDRVRGLDTGADDYLVKPFEFRELEARVRAIVRRSAGQASPLLELGAIRIDTAARTVTRDGIAVALTPKEYALLEILALRRGRLVTRTEIFEHLYDETDPTFSNVLDVFVSNLRGKLGRDLIRTRRGEGYILDA